MSDQRREVDLDDVPPIYEKLMVALAAALGAVGVVGFVIEVYRAVA